MFENLSDRISSSLRSITGKARLTEDNIQQTLREVRMALLELLAPPAPESGKARTKKK